MIARTFPIIAAGALTLYFGFLVGHASHSVGGSDSSGYLNAAIGLASGTVPEPVEKFARTGLPRRFEPAFIPLGYVAGPRPGTMSALYPPGLPLHMAASLALSQEGPFWIAPIAAAASVLLLFLLGRRLGLGTGVSAAGSGILALHPVFLFTSLQPLSDTPATAWALAAVLFAVYSRRDSRWALLAGFAVGIDAMIRPACLLIAIPVVLWLGFDFRRLAFFIAGGALPFLFLMAYDRAAYDRAFDTGYSRYGLLSEFALNHFAPRARHYARWLSTTLTALVLIGWAASLGDRRIDQRLRAALFTWVGGFFLFYSFYGPYDSWIYLRFLLPAIPALVLGASLAARDLFVLGFPEANGRARLIAGALVLLILLLEIRQIRRLGVLSIVDDESAYPEACKMASDRLPPNALILAMAASGALKHYAKFPVARWDWLKSLNPADFLGQARKSGYAPAALLFPSEIADFEREIPGTWRTIDTVHGVVLRVAEP